MNKNTITNSDFASLLEKIESVKFIQIGANDGITVDPIHELIKKGGVNWNGILFEPYYDTFIRLKKTYYGYDNLTLINAAVCDFDGESILYCGNTDPHFTLSKNKAKDMFDVEASEVTVDVVSPKTIIEKHNIDHLDLLQVDTEGRDFTILKSFIENDLLPKIIRFEYVNLPYENYDAEFTLRYLTELKYDCFYVENEGDILAIKKYD